MTRDEIIAILRKARDEWQNANAVTRPLGSTPYPKGDPTRTLREWQADALLAAQSDERCVHFDDGATIADLKARGVLVPANGTPIDVRNFPLVYAVRLPGPAMEDK